MKFNNSKLAKAKKKRERNHDDEEKSPSKLKALDVQKCLFCEKAEEEHVLHEVSTFDADKSIREINDTQLLSRIVGGDLIAMEAKYHLTCMVKLRNRYRSLTRKLNQIPQDTDAKMNESRAFEELTRYIAKSVNSGTLLFKLSEIHSLYVKRLEELSIKKLVNKTRLKDHLLERFPVAQEQYDEETLFSFSRKA